MCRATNCNDDLEQIKQGEAAQAQQETTEAEMNEGILVIPNLS